MPNSVEDEGGLLETAVGVPNGVIEVAAVDLGSNSFHMLVARSQDGRLQVIDRLREPVRLAAGLGEEGRLSAPVQQRAIACLQRFGQRLRGLDPARIRVVGTSTLRRLRDSEQFIGEAERALGRPIEIISGVEEARLVFHGVTHGLPGAGEQRLVIDIGGGSTELIIGKNGQPELMESVGIGCVVFTQRFFDDGRITAARLRDARLAVQVELASHERRYRSTGWNSAIGASGTVRGAWRVMMAQGWTERLITRDALDKTLKLLLATGRVDAINFPGLREDRRPVFAGGLAVLAGVFDSLGLEAIDTSEFALREGMVYDLLGRLQDDDVRTASVGALAVRFGVDVAHAARVELLALQCLNQVAAEWGIERAPAARLLGWAAQLHEIGMAIAHDRHQRHGDYIVRNSEIMGFSQTEQKQLAALVVLQRGKLDALVLNEFPPKQRKTLLRLALLLRLAVLMHRSRVPGLEVPLVLRAEEDRLSLTLEGDWLEQHPLTQADLEREAGYLKAEGYRLRSRSRG